jgi:hypothetical protein
VRPNARRKVRTAVAPVTPNTSVARSGSTVRSWPTIPPTSALTATSSANCPAFARNPRRMVIPGVSSGIGQPDPRAGDQRASPPAPTHADARLSEHDVFHAAAERSASRLSRWPSPVLNTSSGRSERRPCQSTLDGQCRINPALLLRRTEHVMFHRPAGRERLPGHRQPGRTQPEA